jgi:hypothetical protein
MYAAAFSWFEIAGEEREADGKGFEASNDDEGLGREALPFGDYGAAAGKRSIL